jgi:hypothetical protein
MSRIKCLAICMALLVLFAMPAVADWHPGDPHKMHYPQLPNPQGWDVELFRHWLADDWQCSASGPVDDIHFWISWESDDLGVLPIVAVEIHADAGGIPGLVLWARTFLDVPYVAYGSGMQGWMAPEGPAWVPNNHQLFQQVNLTNIPDPFIQTEGTRYWLAIMVDWTSGVQSPPGWKTSLDQFGHTPVWLNWYSGLWTPLPPDPTTGQLLSMAFVITGGEPTPNQNYTWGRMKAMYR